jgi:hypothetical protein
MGTIILIGAPSQPQLGQCLILGPAEIFILLDQMLTSLPFSKAPIFLGIKHCFLFSQFCTLFFSN